MYLFLESYVFSCDYNGWADVPEEEREGIDAFESPRPSASPASPLNQQLALVFLPAGQPANRIVRRRAA
jgi:hypothetical protein